MTKDELESLREGDIVQHQVTGQAYAISLIYAGQIMATRTISISNPAEWALFQKAPAFRGESPIKTARRELDQPMLYCDSKGCLNYASWLHGMYPGKMFCDLHKSLLATIFNNDHEWIRHGK